MSEKRENNGMSKTMVLLLQALIMATAFTIMGFLLRFPLTEGRAANLGLVSIYADPLIIYGYLASIPFFVGLYKMFRLVGLAGGNKFYTPDALKNIKALKICAVLFGLLVLLAGVYIKFSHHPDDDPAGFLAICFMVIVGSVFTTYLSLKFEKKINMHLHSAKKKQPYRLP